MPIDAAQLPEPPPLAAAPVVVPLLALVVALLVVLLLLLPQPAATNAVTARPARLMRTFIGASNLLLWSVLWNYVLGVVSCGVPG